MDTHPLAQLSDPALLRGLVVLIAQESATTAALRAHLAEVDARKLYLPAAYPSMHAYCLGELHLSEEAAFRRIRAARTARRFPVLFAALAQGRLHLSAVVLLTPHLTDENVDTWVALATHETRSRIQQLLAERFPQPDVPTSLVCQIELSPAPVAAIAPGCAGTQVSPAPVGRTEELQTPGPRVAPLSPRRFALQLTLGQGTHDKLRYAQQLLGHQVPTGDIAQVLDRALGALISRLEKQKFAASARPRSSRRCGQAGTRYVPAAVRRAVWTRDEGQCTFVSARARRREGRGPVAAAAGISLRGGEARSGAMRLHA